MKATDKPEAHQDPMLFVVQEHHARQLHYDFRLEMKGVLKSWALPKGPSMNPAEKRLAIMVEDHPMAYLEFEGIIPAGNPGAGSVVVWDKGEYSLLEGEDPVGAMETGKIIIGLKGRILKGAFTLLKMQGRGERNWLLMKKKDGYSDTGWVLRQALTKQKEAWLLKRASRCERDG